MITPTIPPMVLKTREEIDKNPAPQNVGIIPPIVDPIKAKRYASDLGDIKIYFLK